LLKLVEGKGFLNLMGILAPDYKVHSRNTVKSRIEMMYCDMKGKMAWSTTEEASLFLNLLTSNPVADNMRSDGTAFDVQVSVVKDKNKQIHNRP
jgi:hypothetical protein